MAKATSSRSRKSAAERSPAQEQQAQKVLDALLKIVAGGDAHDISKAYAAGALADQLLKAPTKFGVFSVDEIAQFVGVKRKMASNYVAVFTLIEAHGGKSARDHLCAQTPRPQPLYNLVKTATVKDEDIRDELWKAIYENTAPTDRKKWDAFYRSALGKPQVVSQRRPAAPINRLRKLEATSATFAETVDWVPDVVKDISALKDPALRKGCLEAVRASLSRVDVVRSKVDAATAQLKALASTLEESAAA